MINPLKVGSKLSKKIEEFVLLHGEVGDVVSVRVDIGRIIKNTKFEQIDSNTAGRFYETIKGEQNGKQRRH